MSRLAKKRKMGDSEDLGNRMYTYLLIFFLFAVPCLYACRLKNAVFVDEAGLGVQRKVTARRRLFFDPSSESNHDTFRHMVFSTPTDCDTMSDHNVSVLQHAPDSEESSEIVSSFL